MSNTRKPNSPWLRGAEPGNVITRERSFVGNKQIRKGNRRRMQMQARAHNVVQRNKERYASQR